MAPIVAFTLTVYRWFLRVYPEDYRIATGQLQLQTFRDQCLDVHEKAGAIGIIRLWLSLPQDVVFNAVKERAELEPASAAEFETMLVSYTIRDVIKDMIRVVGVTIVLFPSVSNYVTAISPSLYTLIVCVLAFVALSQLFDTIKFSRSIRKFLAEN